MAWSRSGPTNSSAMSSHMPSSTCLPSNSTIRLLSGQGGVGGQGVQQAGFAAAGFACGEQVAVDEADGYGLAEFVAADVDRVVHRQHRPDRDGAGEGAGPVMEGSPLPGGQGDLRPGIGAVA